MRRNAATILKYLIVGCFCFGFILLTLSIIESNEDNSIRMRSPFAFRKKYKSKLDLEQKRDVKEVINLDPLEKIDWHDYRQIAEERARTGPGEQGQGFEIPPSKMKDKDDLYRSNGFNALVSDFLSLERSLPDIRHPDCKLQKYQRELPTVSIIIPFYDEHWTTLLRTFITAIVRAPSHLIKEVILVDDCSTKAFLKGQLDDYIAKNYKDKVRVLRQPKREGLIRTRLLGARNATGDVLLFLDSHCEANTNWLPPLLHPIAEDYRTAVCPFIDVISHETFNYHAQDEGGRGAFDWQLFYKRLPLLPESLKHPARPFVSPVMAGGLFAISRKWFWKLGGYDPGLDIWGGEQYELSFKIWQCGGRMVDAPCSRIGHIYRKFSPFISPPGLGDFIGRNYRRVAEVWMDEYKEYVYQRRPHYRNVPTGDISPQLALRRQLKCKPFKWFMEEIAFDLPKHYPPVEPPTVAEGEIRSRVRSLCIDTKFQDAMKQFSVVPCIRDNPGMSGEQTFEFTYRRDIRPKRSASTLCFDVPKNLEHAPVILYPCHGLGGNQEWKINPYTNQILHVITSKCLDCNPETGEVFVAPCQYAAATQKWKWSKVDMKAIKRYWP